MIRSYTNPAQAQAWCDRHHRQRPIFACVLGFTETALIPNISAAGATPADRCFTAIADAEFLHNGVVNTPVHYPLPPLSAGASPTFIARAIVESLRIPICLLNAGLPIPPSVPSYDLEGMVARCVSSGEAMEPEIVRHLFLEGVRWGEQLGQQAAQSDGYLVIGECVVAGTTTALALLTGLGIPAQGKVNSSHPSCNHRQKAQLVQQGLARWSLTDDRASHLPRARSLPQILELVAAIGDPMQPVVAGMLLTASRQCGVLLAGGTQMLAVLALAQALAQAQPQIPWQPEQVVVGTTRWVVEDWSGDTIGLATAIEAEYGHPIPLIATQLNFAQSRWEQLRAYEAGFVKEGVGAGGLAIAASLYADWHQADFLSAIESLLERYRG
jgi:uncharacterized protein (TIGR00303 family)